MEPTPGQQCMNFRGWTTPGSQERDTAASSFGFPQRAWQSQVATEAVEATKSLGKANTSEELHVLASHGVDADLKGLPMKASTAINMVLRGIPLAEAKLKWWTTRKIGETYLDKLATSTLWAREKDLVVSKDNMTAMSLPDLFFSTASSPSSKDVLQSARKLLRDFFGHIANVSASEVRVEFSSTNLPSHSIFEDQDPARGEPPGAPTRDP